MKTRFENLLIWLLTKMNYKRLNKLLIDTEIVINTKSFVPKDHKWHRFDWNMGFWLKNEEKVKKYDDIVFFKDARKLSPHSEQKGGAK